MLARWLLWRLVGLLAALLAMSIALWLLHGGLGALLREHVPGHVTSASRLAGHHAQVPRVPARQQPGGLGWPPSLPSALRWLAAIALRLAILAAAIGALLALVRVSARRRRAYVRLRIDPYRTDRATAEAIVTMFESLHKRLARPGWQRLLTGQPSLALEIHHSPRSPPRTRSAGEETTYADGAGSGVSRQGAGVGWLAVCCPAEQRELVQAALRGAYPNCRLSSSPQSPGLAPSVLRLKKHASFIKRAKIIDRFEHEREPAVNRLMTTMGTVGRASFVQIALTPAPASFEARAKRLYKRREARLTRGRGDRPLMRDRSLVEEAELMGGLDLQHRPLFFTELRLIGPDRLSCRQIASELRSQEAENRLTERSTTIRHGLLGLYGRRIQRGEGNPLPSLHRNVFASTELAQLWHLPSPDYSSLPVARTAIPVAPAPPSIMRPRASLGSLRDELGPVSIHPSMRRQNVAVPGTVEQGKSSFLVATIAEDLERDRCAIILLDPKGDAADAALSIVPEQRTCTLLDFSDPTCGFNPLAVDAPADVIADYVVGALKNLFTDADIRASSDRYLRNAIIAVLAHDRRCTLWDAARLLSVGEEGYAYRARVSSRVRAMPELKEVSEFFTAELSAQLADARSTTTAKLDAPVNKLARLLNSPSIKRVLLNESLTVDFDRVISHQEILIVKGALGAMGAGNTSVLMQLLVGMLDAALARQQDDVDPEHRIAVALKVDEAPLALNRGFAETIALKRSAGLETVACWQADAQWTDREVRDQLDALFAHRVHFATASVRDARASAALMMAEFSDNVRSGDQTLSTLGHPDARLHLPKHHAIASWTTPEGRQPPFLARTIPLRVDKGRIARHAAIQAARGGRRRTDLRQPHWDAGQRPVPSDAPEPSPAGASSEQAPPVASEPTVPVAHAEVLPVAAEQVPPMAVPVASEQVPQVAPEPVVPVAASTTSMAALPEAAALSYGELADLDGAPGVRWTRGPTVPSAIVPDRLDLEMLALVASLGHVLTTQLHRRFNPTRAATTTQRRLKRLADADLLERFQFHRPDGGGVPMCCAITRSGLSLLHAHDLCTRLEQQELEAPSGPPRPDPTASRADRRLRQARRDAHVAGWVLALERALADRAHGLVLRGRPESILVPPLRSTPQGRTAIGPADLRLPAGLVAHDFLRSGPSGERVEARRFETLRPDATVELSGGGRALDLLVEFDDRPARGRDAAKLERYDHFLAGWSTHCSRYSNRLDSPPFVVFVSRDRARARDCARAADTILGACRAYAGEYPADWRYPGRELILFAAERDIHEGLLHAYAPPRLPPHVRSAAGDPRSRRTEPLVREILGA